MIQPRDPQKYLNDYLRYHHDEIFSVPLLNRKRHPHVALPVSELIYNHAKEKGVHAYHICIFSSYRKAPFSLESNQLVTHHYAVATHNKIYDPFTSAEPLEISEFFDRLSGLDGGVAHFHSADRNYSKETIFFEADLKLVK